jgi:hypothetical protein
MITSQSALLIFPKRGQGQMLNDASKLSSTTPRHQLHRDAGWALNKARLPPIRDVESDFGKADGLRISGYQPDNSSAGVPIGARAHALRNPSTSHFYILGNCSPP